MEAEFTTKNAALAPDQQSEAGLRNRERPLTPDLIFMNLDKAHFPILVTLPCERTANKIPENFGLEPNGGENNLILEFRNNGFIHNVQRVLSLFKLTNLLEQHGSPYNDAIVLAAALRDYPRADLMQTLAPLKGGEVRLEEFDDVNYSVDYHQTPKLEAIVYAGRRYTLDEFKANHRETFGESYKFLDAVAYRESDHLFRAPTAQEWNFLLEENLYIIRQGDNFESVTRGQVAEFAQNNEYAGIIMRIPVKGPFFAKRITQASGNHVQAALAHFVDGSEIFVSRDGENFTSLEDFRSYTA